MKPVLFYDTETTGIPNHNLPNNHPLQPRVTQIAAELVDTDTGDVLGALNFLIKPEGWIIPDKLAALTGISTERADKFGVQISHVLTTFLSLSLASELRVGHNEKFDAKMMAIEIDRLFPLNMVSWGIAPTFCTQEKSVNIINLPPTPKMVAAGRNHPKSPNLTEAYKYFTGLELSGAHNAAVDIMACKEVYFGILKHNSSHVVTG